MLYNILKIRESRAGDVAFVEEHMLRMLKALDLVPSARKNKHKQTKPPN